MIVDIYLLLYMYIGSTKFMLSQNAIIPNIQSSRRLFKSIHANDQTVHYGRESKNKMYAHTKKLDATEEVNFWNCEQNSSQ
jgi:hypothetical protein